MQAVSTSCSWRRRPPASACFRRACSSVELQAANEKNGISPCWLQVMLLCPDHTRANSWCDCTGHWTSHIACMPCCEPKAPCVVLALSGHSIIDLPPTQCDSVAGHGVHVAMAANASAFQSWKSWNHGRRPCRRRAGARPSTPPATATAAARALLLRCSGA